MRRLLPVSRLIFSPWLRDGACAVSRLVTFTVTFKDIDFFSLVKRRRMRRLSPCDFHCYFQDIDFFPLVNRRRMRNLPLSNSPGPKKEILSKYVFSVT
jgi:hypothetical protein